MEQPLKIELPVEVIINPQTVKKMKDTLNEMSNQFIKFSLAFNDLRNQLEELENRYPELFTKDENART